MVAYWSTMVRHRRLCSGSRNGRLAAALEGPSPTQQAQPQVQAEAPIDRSSSSDSGAGHAQLNGQVRHSYRKQSGTKTSKSFVATCVRVAWSGAFRSYLRSFAPHLS
jgi:hypothetical protein